MLRLVPRTLCHMGRVMRKPDFVYAKTKAQISCAVTAQLISAFVFATRIVQLLFYLYRKLQDSCVYLCDCTDWFVSDLVGNPDDQFSRVAAKHDYVCGCQLRMSDNSDPRRLGPKISGPTRTQTFSDPRRIGPKPFWTQDESDPY